MQIPQWPIAGERERQLIDEVLSSPQWGGFHEIVGQFEQQFAATHHCRHGVSAVNGTLTLEMALICLGVKPGDEVIVPAISFVSTATAVSRVGGVPVFVDIEPFTFSIDPARVEEAITGKTKAIVPVHFGGPLANMDRIMAIARRHGLKVLEDAAHAQGSEWNGKRAGVPCSPFYPHTLYENPVFQQVPNRVMPCPNSETSIHDVFWIPHYVLLGDESLMEQVAQCVRRAMVFG